MITVNTSTFSDMSRVSLKLIDSNVSETESAAFC